MSRRGRGAKPPTRKELAEFAAAYQTELALDPRGVLTRVCEAWDMHRTTGYRWLALCAVLGIEVTLPSRARPVADQVIGVGGHVARRARWGNGSDGSWLACREDRMPWPCPAVEEAQR